MSVSTTARSSAIPASACSARLRPSKAKGLVTTATVRMPSSLATAATTGAEPGAGAAAETGGDEDHVGAVEHLLDALPVLERGVLADLGVGAGAEAGGEARAELELDRRRGGAQRLEIGVGDDELHAGELGADHPVDRVRAAAAEADDLDLGRLALLLELEYRLPPAVVCSIGFSSPSNVNVNGASARTAGRATELGLAGGGVSILGSLGS